uniref:Uncharacterized protein n=1 Tax=Fagus sylvatica TaxID=28930 RepID=A0A2N9I0L9_FAGSY
MAEQIKAKAEQIGAEEEFDGAVEGRSGREEVVQAEERQFKSEEGKIGSEVRLMVLRSDRSRGRLISRQIEGAEMARRSWDGSWRTRSRPNISHGTDVKSEKAHINAEEMLDAVEVHYRRFGEFLSLLLLLNQLNAQKRPKTTVLL